MSSKVKYFHFISVNVKIIVRSSLNFNLLKGFFSNYVFTVGSILFIFEVDIIFLRAEPFLVERHFM